MIYHILNMAFVLACIGVIILLILTIGYRYHLNQDAPAENHYFTPMTDSDNTLYLEKEVQQ